ncbi:MAG: hypothetical protein SOY53_02250 [Prevotella sp.]|nr:hypothetical protein [Leyella stercorea]MDY4088245.1 hypothetical protein [Prevotella sp.]
MLSSYLYTLEGKEIKKHENSTSQHLNTSPSQHLTTSPSHHPTAPQ